MLKSVLRTALALTVGLSATQAKAQSLLGNSAGMPSMAVPAGSVAGLEGSTGINMLGSPNVTQPSSMPSSSGSSAGTFLYGSFDFLVWHVPSKSVPIPLGTSGYPPNLGVLSTPGTTLLGGNELKYNGASPGMKIEMGIWYDAAHSIGSSFNISWMFSQKSSYAVQSDGNGNPTIARPFLDTLFYQEDVRLLASAGFSTGGYTTQSTFRMWGAEVNPLEVLLAGDTTSALHLILGFKYQYLNESYSILDNSTAINAGTVNFQGNSFGAGWSTSVLDRANSSNNFYGGNIGLKWHGELSSFTYDITGKVAFGGNEEVVDLYGSSRLYGPQGQLYGATPGGLLALPSNSGKFDTYKFAVLPELNVQLGYKIIQGVEVHVSYNLLYISSVVRAAEQFGERTVNSGYVPTSPNYGILSSSAAPVPYLQRTDFTAQAVGFGLTLTY